MDSEKEKTMWFNITENFPVQTCLDLNIYIQGEERKAQKELLEELIKEYEKEEERSHFGLKLLSKRDELSNK